MSVFVIELWSIILLNLVLSALVLGGMCFYLIRTISRNAPRRSFQPVRQQISFTQRTEIQFPVSTGIGARFTTRGPPLSDTPAPEDRSPPGRLA